MAEYAITASILIPLMLTAIPGLNQNLSGLFQNTLLNGIAQSGTLVVPKFAGELKANPTFIAAPANQTPILPTNSTIQLTLSTGQTLNIANLPANLQQAIETSGVNGATNLYSNAIASLAQQMLQMGNISQSQSQTLMDLANQGHKMAEIQNIIEQIAAQSNNNLQFFENQTITYDNKTYTTIELIMLTEGNIVANDLTATLNKLATYNPQNPTFWIGEQTVQFSQLYQQALQDGSLSDPNIKTLIDYLVLGIYVNSDNLALGVRYSSFNPASITQQQISTLNNIGSVNICTTGNGSTTE